MTVSAVRPSAATWSSSSTAARSWRALPHASMTELNETIDGLAPATRISLSSASASFQCFDFLYQRMRAL